MVAVPGATPVIVPPLTFATAASLVVHVTVFFVAFDGAIVAVTVSVLPSNNDTDDLLRVIEVGSITLISTGPINCPVPPSEDMFHYK